MKIGIMGTLMNCGNRGVMALGSSLINLCLCVLPGAEVVLLVGNRDDRPAPFRVGGRPKPIPVVPCRLSPLARPCDHLVWVHLMSLLYRLLPFAGVRAAICRSTPWVRTVAESDFVGDIRGGDSFSDIYGLKRFLLGFLMSWTVVLVKGTMVQFPQTYGPYKSRLARLLARFLLKRSSVIIARDKQSQKVAQDLVGSRKQVRLSPDVAFSLEPIQPERIELAPPIPALNFADPASPPAAAALRQLSTLNMPASLIGLNVNGLMYNGGYTRDNMFGLQLDYPRFLSRLVETLLAEHPGELWLIPHTYAAHGNVESDNEASEKVRQALPPELQQRVRLVAAEYDQHELKWLIGQCDFFVGSRMHACIAALSQGVPCVGVAYSMKFAGVFESVGMEEWVVDARSTANDDAVERVVARYRQRDSVRIDLAARAEAARQRLDEVFRDLMKRYLPAEERLTARPPELAPAHLP